MSSKSETVIRIHGAGLQIGKEAISVSNEGTTVLLDYGVLMTDRKPEFPERVTPSSINAVFLSHAHLDHSGGLPLLYLRGGPPIYTTTLTAKITTLLIEDMLNISRYYVPYEELELREMLDHVHPITFNQKVHIKNIELEGINAGHIPGSLMAKVRTKSSTILFTGDFNTIDTRLLAGARVDLSDVDVLIMESTYASTDHPDRNQLERDFASKVKEIVESGGIALVPAFAVGRSQEIVSVLRAQNYDGPIYLDGMAREAAKIMKGFPKYIKNYEEFTKVIKSVRLVKGNRERQRALQKPGVIVSPAGMLRGGAVMFYLEHIIKDHKNGIFLVSFQIPGTPGRVLLDTGKIAVEGKLVDASDMTYFYDFSAHSGRKELLDFVKQVKGGTKVILIHGEPETTKAFQDTLRGMGIDAVAANNGDSFKI
ncbi:MAG: MBL fold metallo-hydrolase [Thermoprotei archaeon]|jgi:putative mRNA 3-end processing factor